MLELAIGALVFLRNSAKDSKKGDKMAQRWLGPYKVVQILEKGVYKLQIPSTGKKSQKMCKWLQIHVMCAFFALYSGLIILGSRCF